MAIEAPVFISYAADTKPLAEELTRALETAGISAWADFKDMKPGQVWQAEVAKALSQAQVMLILVGPDSRATSWTEMEWRAALAESWSDSRKALIPVVSGAGEPPPFLRDRYPLRIDPQAEPATWTARVVNVVKSNPNWERRPLSKEDQDQREARLDEIERAARRLREEELGFRQEPGR